MATHLLRTAAVLAFVLAVLWALSACAVSQQLSIRTDGSGETTIGIDIDPEIASYIRDLAKLTGAELPETGLVNLEPIYDSLRARAGVTVIRVEAPNEHLVELEFTFEDVRAIFRSASLLGKTGVVTLEELEEGTSFKLYLDIDNYNQLSTLFPMLDDPVIRAMGPEENTEITAKDYLTMMGFVFGPDGPPAISDSLITIEITAAGELVSQHGGRVEDGVVIFEIALLDLLLLHKPVDLQVVFR